MTSASGSASSPASASGERPSAATTAATLHRITFRRVAIVGFMAQVSPKQIADSMDRNFAGPKPARVYNVCRKSTSMPAEPPDRATVLQAIDTYIRFAYGGDPPTAVKSMLATVRDWSGAFYRCPVFVKDQRTPPNRY